MSFHIQKKRKRIILREEQEFREKGGKYKESVEILIAPPNWGQFNKILVSFEKHYV